MFLHVWQDWINAERLDPKLILPIMEGYAGYRARFGDVMQIILNHTDMARRPDAISYWRLVDPILYRTPAYARGERLSFHAESIVPYGVPYGKGWGSPCFHSRRPSRNDGSLIGTQSGPPGYRQRVARQAVRVGIGGCSPPSRFDLSAYAQRLAECLIIVFTRGGGEQSQRHWDTWLSGKPMLTDRDADAVEPQCLRDGEHYSVFGEPEQIPSLVE